MDYRHLFFAAVPFAVLFLASSVLFFILYRKHKAEGAVTERNNQELFRQIEELNNEVAKLSALYDQSLEECRKRTEFYSNITHELKTPLSVILGAIQLMEKKRGTPGEDEGMIGRNLMVIRHNCYRMLRLVNNLLDLAKMEAGYQKLKPVNCDLDILLEEIVQSVMPYAAQKQIELCCGKPPEPIRTSVDIEKMERILLNLLSNSIKFTKPGGSIKVSSGMADGRAYISVKDTGVGIPAAMQAEIFGRFRQTGNHPAMENEGCGIGLSLVKSFVELHNGNIRVVSEKGMGSEFIIDLPVTGADDSAADAAADNDSFRVREAANIEFADLHPIAS